MSVRIFDRSIRPPARTLPPLHFHTPFYRLPEHRLPVLWHLYRRILREAPDDTHREAARVRWRNTASRHARSPAIVAKLLRQEHTLLSDYRAIKSQAGSPNAELQARLDAISNSERRRLEVKRAEVLMMDEYVSKVGRKGCCNSD